MTGTHGRMPTEGAMVAYIAMYTLEHGWPPSRRDVAERFEISLERTQVLLRSCRDSGLIDIGTGARQIKVTPRGVSLIEQMKHIGDRMHQL